MATTIPSFDLETRPLFLLFLSLLFSSLLFTSPRMGFRFFCGVMLDRLFYPVPQVNKTNMLFSSLSFHALFSSKPYSHLSLPSFISALALPDFLYAMCLELFSVPEPTASPETPPFPIFRVPYGHGRVTHLFLFLPPSLWAKCVLVPILYPIGSEVGLLSPDWLGNNNPASSSP